jgi:hypothetical protein
MSLLDDIRLESLVAIDTVIWIGRAGNGHRGGTEAKVPADRSRHEVAGKPLSLLHPLDR